MFSHINALGAHRCNNLLKWMIIFAKTISMKFGLKNMGFEDVLSFGKYKGKKIVIVMANDIDYLKWLKENGYSFDEKVDKCLRCIKDKL